MMTFKLDDKAEELYTKFNGGMPETAVHHVISFRNLAQKLERKENCNYYDQLIKDKKVDDQLQPDSH